MKNQRSSGYGSSFSRGFTLVEILAALAVFALIVLILGQITSATTRTTILSNQTNDSGSQSRLAFDRIGLDLVGIVKRTDVDFYARPYPDSSGANAGYSTDDSNTSLLFLTTVNSFDSSLSSTQNRSISLISYQVTNHPDNTTGAGGQVLPCLIRAGKAIPWARPVSWGTKGYMGLDANGLPVRFNSTDTNFVASLLPTKPSSTSGNDYDILAPGVIRLVIGFQLYPDNLPATLADGTTYASAQGQVVYSAPIRSLIGNDGTKVKYLDLNRVSSIVVGLVTLDRNSLKLLTPTAASTIISKFTTPANNNLPLQTWASIANGLAASLSGSIPKPALQAVHVYQRFYPITPFPTQQP